MQDYSSAAYLDIILLNASVTLNGLVSIWGQHWHLMGYGEAL